MKNDTCLARFESTQHTHNENWCDSFPTWIDSK